MRQILLFSILFLAIYSISKAQLTVTGTASTGNDTSVGQFYVLTAGVGGGFVKDVGTNVYVKTTAGCGQDNDFIIRINNYWYIGDWGVCFGNNAYKGLYYRYPVQTNSIDPPCSGLWEIGNYGVLSIPSNVAGSGTYTMVTIAGTTCSTNNPITPSPFNIFSNSISIPSLNYGQIINIPTPITTGMMVYNTTSNCVSIYNGTSWSCLVAASSATYNVTTLTTLPFTLTNQHNYVTYTGIAGTLTIPVASTCVGRLYNISNYGMGIITLSQPYTNSNSGTSTTVNINTNVQIIANSSGWVKVN